jgi:hypothetical protein
MVQIHSQAASSGNLSNDKMAGVVFIQNQGEVYE